MSKNKKTLITFESSEIRLALAKKFCAPEWVIFWEVAAGTGSFANRHADAVAMGIWPSRGLAVHGFEIKVSRGDWLRELRAPEKSEEVQAYCDHWWIVAPKDLVKPDEVPAAWGLYEITGRGLSMKKDAPKLEATPFDRMFAAALLRRAGQLDRGMLNAAVKEHLAEMRKQHEEALERAKEAGNWEYKSLKKKVDEFQAASGINIENSHLSGPRLGEAVVDLYRRFSSLPDLLTDAMELGQKITKQAKAAHAALGIDENRDV